MRGRRGSARRLATALVAAVAFLALAGSALAYHRADRAETRGIAQAFSRHRALDCGDLHRVHVQYAVISTANGRFAAANCGYFGHFYNILRRPSIHSERWTDVLPIGDNPPECSRVVRVIPRNVIHDLRLGGFRGNRSVKYC